MVNSFIRQKMEVSTSSEAIDNQTFRGRCSIKYLVQTPFRRSLTLTIIFTIIILSLVAILLEILVVYPKQTLQSTKNATAVTVETFVDTTD